MPKIKRTYSGRSLLWLITALWVVSLSLPGNIYAKEDAHAALYKKLSGIAFSADGDLALLAKLNKTARSQDWAQAEATQFVGNLRILKSVQAPADENRARIYLLRKLSGELYILSVPADPGARAEIADSLYAGLDRISGNKMVFHVKMNSLLQINTQFPVGSYNDIRAYAPGCRNIAARVLDDVIAAIISNMMERSFQCSFNQCLTRYGKRCWRLKHKDRYEDAEEVLHRL